MPATDYRVMQVPNWKAGWNVIAPVVTDGLALLQSIILHSHNLPQEPTGITIKRFSGVNWLVVTMSDRLDLTMEQHLGLTPE
jgi:hypothetical protein